MGSAFTIHSTRHRGWMLAFAGTSVVSVTSLAGLASCTSEDDVAGDTDSGISDAGGSGDGGDGDGDCAPASTRTGEATYYDFADGSGNCSFPATPDALLVGAMNPVDYEGSNVCGTCVRIDGPDGSVDVRIVDQCPECLAGDIDLSPEAFERIAPLSAGRVDVAWQTIPCDVSGPIAYHFKEGSNPWWTAVQIRNHRHGVVRFEVRLDGVWVDVPRLDYNYFVRDSGMGEGPFTFRVTDVHGHVVEDAGIGLLDDGTASGTSQFPVCAD